MIHDLKPVVEVFGIPWLRSITGQNVGFIENIVNEKLSQTFVFVSKNFPSEDSVP